MRRFALFTLVALFCTPAIAGDNHDNGPKKHHKKRKGDKDNGKKGKGKKKPWPKPKPGPKPKHEIVGTVSGAGQRLSFSFGGELTIRDDGKGRGQFVITAHPSAPGGNTLNVTCFFARFENATINGTLTEFDAHGRCQILTTEGEINRVTATQHVTIVDNGSSGDTIDVDIVGTTGINIASGALSFGNFDVAPATS